MENILAASNGKIERINIRKLFLLSGLCSSVLYVVTDIVASLTYPGYSITGQNYSELLATGAPTRQWLLLVTFIYNTLVACFAAAVWRSFPAIIARINGAIIMGYAIMSTITPLYFQMDMRGSEVTPMGSLHPPMTFIMSFFIILSIGSGAFLLKRQFRIFSFVTIAVVSIFGLLTSLQVPRLEAGQDTPLMGFTERINIYLTMLWFAILSIKLARNSSELQQIDLPIQKNVN